MEDILYVLHTVTRTYHKVTDAGKRYDWQSSHGYQITAHLGHEVGGHSIKTTHVLVSVAICSS